MGGGLIITAAKGVRELAEGKPGKMVYEVNVEYEVEIQLPVGWSYDTLPEIIVAGYRALGLKAVWSIHITKIEEKILN